MNELVAMGFSEENASAALLKFNNDIDLSLDFLLSSDSNCINNTNNSKSVLVLGISQYTFGSDGTSACTVIAANVLKIILVRLKNKSDVDNEELLSSAVMDGVSYFGTISNGEHLSVDEIDKSFFDTVENKATLQGLVSNNGSFEAMFREARESCDPNKHIGLIITKTPETVCVVLPPTSRAPAESQWMIFDSHSRPQFGYAGAYVITSNSEEDIVNHLLMLFPAIEFDRDADLAQLQYNMFEASVFQNV